MFKLLLHTNVTISIHAPAWGATDDRFHATEEESFQSTRPRGARLPVFERPRLAQSISIHAPAWGATIIKPLSNDTALFQSTRPRGARRHFSGLADPCSPISIHAPARGATPVPKPCLTQRHFNPRARVGRDPVRRPPLSSPPTFQSTRPRGARRRRVAERRRNQLFQSTRPRGARRQ